MIFHIITLFPNSFDSYINESILARAIKTKKIKIKFYNPRDFANNKRQVDDRPYGGGPGMVIKAEPVIKAVLKAMGKKTGVKIIFLSPSGKQFDNSYAKKISKTHKEIIIIAGHYEGIDARVKKIFKTEDLTIGPYVLTGGELPAMLIVDVITRQIEGVLGDAQSLEENRNASPEVYTRPESFKYKNKNYKVPKVLLSGNHKEIEEWRQNKNSKIGS
ncbi:TPA: tRNA (guanosine(37)-N1)-methyltransferase TrmD [Candidatus Campbellbacteria bacterium]|nr:MAG: tRNA (guanine-n(1)-)-methyltransferase, tRNA (guanine37-N1)-methyltransferase [Candidatus Campbellbacteria bacterium GW2011_OD1_34_28]KKP74616.1 MAG: tRNA (guanine-N(1)-)-methyltransferase [Candidatus Campbellbacteria bacterium GW2011_GWD2_35_24]KKP76748.1 MAG: tRNA (guanine-N(1)-)-methyltransferase [Candidatus Campbellbacteria bacterium GW2011_GWC1_35_31]KKP78681.1 MAG: tRNA (guanine-N(1)-)-methyltransferase [Candidatus Campbellbacteria bacterium GW2011_GWD1_35_49]HAP74377.1 tRNA (guan